MARILHVITGLRTGGAEMMLWKFLSLTHTHHSQAVISLMDEGTIGPRIARLNVPVCALDLRKTSPNPARAVETKIVMQTFHLAIGLRKNEPRLMDWVNDWVKANLKNGKLNAIYKKNFGTDLPPNILNP